MKGFSLLAILVITSCASFNTPTGEKAAFSQLGSCRGLGQWVEPARERYGDKDTSWTEIKSREQLKFLFTDEYFEPIFGVPIDELDGAQITVIHKALKGARKNCKNEGYLISLSPGIFLSRVFNRKLPKTAFSRSFVTEYAFAQRGQSSGSGALASSANLIEASDGSDSKGAEEVRLVQRELSRHGFDVGYADGVLGKNTRNAIIAFKKTKNIQPINTQITPALITQLKTEAANINHSDKIKTAKKEKKLDQPRYDTNAFSGDIDQYFSTSKFQQYWLCNGVDEKLGKRDWRKNESALIFEFGDGWVRDFQPGVKPQGHRESTWKKANDGKLTITNTKSPVDWEWVGIEPNDGRSFSMTWSRQVQWSSAPQVNIDTWQCKPASIEVAFGDQESVQEYRPPKVAVKVIEENLISGGSVPLTSKSIQEALDVVQLLALGQTPSDDALNACAANDGCPVMGGIATQRMKLQTVHGCILKQASMASCKFRWFNKGRSTMEDPGGVASAIANSLLSTIDLATEEADTVLILDNGKWRFRPI